MAIINSYFNSPEIDPTVPEWAKASSKPSYTASEVGAVTSSELSSLSTKVNSLQTTVNNLASAGNLKVGTFTWNWYGSGSTYDIKTYTFNPGVKMVYLATILRDGVRRHELFPCMYRDDYYGTTYMSNRVLTPNSGKNYFKYMQAGALDEIEMPYSDRYYETNFSLSSDGKTLTCQADGYEENTYYITGFYLY